MNVTAALHESKAHMKYALKS